MTSINNTIYYVKHSLLLSGDIELNSGLKNCLLIFVFRT